MTFEFAMPTPPNEVCSLCDCEMGMTWISYGVEKERIGWKCECGGTQTTCIKEYKMAVREGGLKLCKDCKYLSDVIFSDCLKAPKGRSRVDGRQKHETASLQRDYWNIVWWRCGKKGRFWEPKE